MNQFMVGLMLCTSMFMYQPAKDVTTDLTPRIAVYETYPEWRPDPPEPERPHLTKSAGTFAGPSGKETYYNLNMSGCISYMRSLGYDEETYPYWIREDGAKMLGQYVMCAADLDIRPKGTILETSLGSAIVVDTGAFAFGSVTTQLDMAADW